MKVVLRNIIYYNVVRFDEIDAGIVPRDSYWRKHSVEFFKLVLMKRVSKVAAILDEDRFQVFQYNDSHQTPLLVAADKGSPAMVKLLIKFGSDVNWRDVAGRSALYYAV